MGVNMKTLEEHNTERLELHRKMEGNEPRLNGIECPSCKAELYDSNPMVSVASYPAQKNIRCFSCGYIGRRIA